MYITSEVAHSCPTLCNPMDCSLPGSSIHGIFQARVLEWVAISFSRRSSRPRDRTQVSCIAGRCFTVWATREALHVQKQQAKEAFHSGGRMAAMQEMDCAMQLVKLGSIPGKKKLNLLHTSQEKKIRVKRRNYKTTERKHARTPIITLEQRILY